MNFFGIFWTASLASSIVSAHHTTETPNLPDPIEAGSALPAGHLSSIYWHLPQYFLSLGSEPETSLNLQPHRAPQPLNLPMAFGGQPVLLNLFANYKNAANDVIFFRKAFDGHEFPMIMLEPKAKMQIQSLTNYPLEPVEPLVQEAETAVGAIANSAIGLGKQSPAKGDVLFVNSGLDSPKPVSLTEVRLATANSESQIDSVQEMEQSAPQQLFPKATTSQEDCLTENPLLSNSPSDGINGCSSEARFQIWLGNKLILKTFERDQAYAISQRLNYSLQTGELDLSSLELTYADSGDTLMGKIGSKFIFAIDPTLAEQLGQDQDLLAIEWVNNLRVALGAQPLSIATAQANIHQLNATENSIEGIASWYGPYFHGRPTATGELFDQNSLTAAHPSLPFGTLLKVKNLQNGETVIVRVNDRGPYVGERSLDLSREAARQLKAESDGVIPFRATVMERG